MKGARFWWPPDFALWSFPKEWAYSTPKCMTYNGQSQQMDDLGAPILGNLHVFSGCSKKEWCSPSWVLHTRFVSCLSYSWQHWFTVLPKKSWVAFLNWMAESALLSWKCVVDIDVWTNSTIRLSISMIWSSMQKHLYLFTIFPSECFNPHFYLPRSQPQTSSRSNHTGHRRHRSQSLRGSCSEGTWPRQQQMFLIFWDRWAINSKLWWLIADC